MNRADEAAVCVQIAEAAEHPVLRRAAIERLGQSPLPTATDALVRIARSESDGAANGDGLALRCAAIRALRQSPFVCPEDAATLAVFALDPDLGRLRQMSEQECALQAEAYMLASYRGFQLDLDFPRRQIILGVGAYAKYPAELRIFLMREAGALHLSTPGEAQAGGSEDTDWTDHGDHRRCEIKRLRQATVAVFRLPRTPLEVWCGAAAAIIAASGGNPTDEMLRMARGAAGCPKERRVGLLKVFAEPMGSRTHEVPPSPQALKALAEVLQDGRADLQLRQVALAGLLKQQNPKVHQALSAYFDGGLRERSGDCDWLRLRGEYLSDLGDGFADPSHRGREAVLQYLQHYVIAATEPERAGERMLAAQTYTAIKTARVQTTTHLTPALRQLLGSEDTPVELRVELTKLLRPAGPSDRRFLLEIYRRASTLLVLKKALLTSLAGGSNREATAVLQEAAAGSGPLASHARAIIPAGALLGD